MKAFNSYRFTGETEENLRNLLTPVTEALHEAGAEAYCNFFDEDLPVRSKNFKPQDYVFDAFKTINGTNMLFVILNSEDKSEGMLMEIGYALAKGKKVVVAVKDGVQKSYVPGMASLVLPYSNVEDLAEKIKNADFKAL
jgi:nucleoside 2-deoxyribosyltransferase